MTDLVIGVCRAPRLARALRHLGTGGALLVRETVTVPDWFDGERLIYRAARITPETMQSEFGNRLFDRRWRRVFIIFNHEYRDDYREVERLAFVLGVPEIWGILPSLDWVSITTGLRWLRDQWFWCGPLLTVGLAVLMVPIAAVWGPAAWLVSRFLPRTRQENAVKNS